MIYCLFSTVCKLFGFLIQSCLCVPIAYRPIQQVSNSANSAADICRTAHQASILSILTQRPYLNYHLQISVSKSLVIAVADSLQTKFSQSHLNFDSLSGSLGDLIAFGYWLGKRLDLSVTVFFRWKTRNTFGQLQYSSVFGTDRNLLRDYCERVLSTTQRAKDTMSSRYKTEYRTEKLKTEWKTELNFILQALFSSALFWFCKFFFVSLLLAVVEVLQNSLLNKQIEQATETNANLGKQSEQHLKLFIRYLSVSLTVAW